MYKCSCYLSVSRSVCWSQDLSQRLVGLEAGYDDVLSIIKWWLIFKITCIPPKSDWNIQPCKISSFKFQWKPIIYLECFYIASSTQTHAVQ
jgi:hypothetical protein